MFTLRRRLGSLDGAKIWIVGDVLHSRVARSNILAFTRMGAHVTVCGPPTLLPPKPKALGVEHSYRPEQLLPEADVVMTLRIQLERQNKTTALVTMCIGGGQGIATILERV